MSKVITGTDWKQNDDLSSKSFPKTPVAPTKYGQRGEPRNRRNGESGRYAKLHADRRRRSARAKAQIEELAGARANDQATNAELAKLRLSVASITDRKLLRHCSRFRAFASPTDGVLIRVNSQRAYAKGLMRCKNPHTCPDCARFLSLDRATQLRPQIEGLQKPSAGRPGVTTALLTLTIERNKAFRLADQNQAIDQDGGVFPKGPDSKDGRGRLVGSGSFGVLRWPQGDHAWSESKPAEDPPKDPMSVDSSIDTDEDGMADFLNSLQRSERMSRIRSHNTKPELVLRRALLRLGLAIVRGNPVRLEPGQGMGAGLRKALRVVVWALTAASEKFRGRCLIDCVILFIYEIWTASNRHEVSRPSK